MRSYDFRWIDWNIEKIERHGLAVEEVEFVVNTAVIYVIDPDDRLYVIHARPLTPSERRRHRRRR